MSNHQHQRNQASSSSSSISYTTKQVSDVIETLNNPHVNQKDRAIADKFLQKFRSSEDAWLILDEFLGETLVEKTSSERRIMFAALTMQKKLVDDFDQLPPDSYESLGDSILHHMQRYGRMVTTIIEKNPNARPRGSAFNVTKNLAYAYADFLVQTRTTSLNDIVNNLLELFSPPEGSLVLLEILRAIPHECHRIHKRLSSEQAIEMNDFLKQLDSMGEDVLQLLLDIMEAALPTGTVAVVMKVFHTFGTWVSHTIIPGPVIANCPLLQHCIEAALQYPELFEVACETMQDIIGSYRNILSVKDKPVTDIMIPGILQLQPLYDQAVANNDDDAALLLARLFTDAATEYLYWMIRVPEKDQQPDPSWKQIRIDYLELLNKCIAHSSTEVSDATFRFWHMLVEEYDIAEKESRSRGHVKGQPQILWCDILRSEMSESLLAVVPTILLRLRYPETQEWNATPVDKQDNFRHDFRYACLDVVLCAAKVCGYEVILQVLSDSLAEESDLLQGFLEKEKQRLKRNIDTIEGDGWQGIEASLYAIRGIGRVVPSNENKVLPEVLSMLPDLPYHTEIRATSYRVLGRYAGWIGNHRDSVPSIMEFILNGLYGSLSSTGSTNDSNGQLVPVLANTVVECSSKALRDIGAVALSSCMDFFLEIPSKVPLISLNREIYDEIIKMISRAIGTSMAKEFTEPLLSIATPIIERLTILTSNVKEGIRLCAMDGSLAACLTTPDGIVNRGTASRLGLSEETVETIWKYAQNHQGSVVPYVDKFTIEPYTGRVLMYELLYKLVTLTDNCLPDNDAVMEMDNLFLTRDKYDELQPPEGMSWDDYHYHQDHLVDSCWADLQVGHIAVQEAAWDVLCTIWGTIEVGNNSVRGDGDILDLVVSMWRIGASKGMENFQEVLEPVCQQIIGRMNEAPVPQAIVCLRDLITNKSLMRVKDDTVLIDAVNELTLLVFGTVTVNDQPDSKAMAENNPFLFELFFLYEKSWEDLSVSLLKSTTVPRILQFITEALPLASYGIATSMLRFLAIIIRSSVGTTGKTNDDDRRNVAETTESIIHALLVPVLEPVFDALLNTLLTLFLSPDYGELLQEYELQEAIYNCTLISSDNVADIVSMVLSTETPANQFGENTFLPKIQQLPESFRECIYYRLFPTNTAQKASPDTWRQIFLHLHNGCVTNKWETLEDYVGQTLKGEILNRGNNH